MSAVCIVLYPPFHDKKLRSQSSLIIFSDFTLYFVGDSPFSNHIVERYSYQKILLAEPIKSFDSYSSNQSKHTI